MEFNIDTIGWVNATDRYAYPSFAELGIRVIGAGSIGIIEFFYSDIPGQSWNQVKLDAAQQILQDLIDIRIPLINLPISHPHRLSDPVLLYEPGLAPAFWDPSDGSGDIVYREMIVTNFTWTGERLIWSTTAVHPDLNRI